MTTTELPSSTTVAPEIAEPESPLLPGLGANVELLTPHQAGGDRPRLEWSAVPGAAFYGVYLRSPDNGIYWAWQGAETSVPVGGAELTPGSGGPPVAPGMTWVVIAYDDAMFPIGSSEVRPIDP